MKVYKGKKGRPDGRPRPGRYSSGKRNVVVLRPASVMIRKTLDPYPPGGLRGVYGIGGKDAGGFDKRLVVLGGAGLPIRGFQGIKTLAPGQYYLYK
jgi:hypothetical protein